MEEVSVKIILAKFDSEDKAGKALKIFTRRWKREV